MSFDTNIEAHFRQTYRDNVVMVAQQMKGRIRPAVTSVPASGEAQDVADLVGRVKARRGNAAELRNIHNPPTNSRRWLVFPEPVKSGQYITTAEKLRRASDPTSIYVKSHVSAVVRELDDINLGIVETEGGVFTVGKGGILGAAIDGKNPGAATATLPSSCYTLAAGAGLTLNKLTESKERLNSDEFGLEDDDEMWAAITPKQVTDLLNIAAATGANLNAFQVEQLKSGKPTMLMGYNWIVTNRLPRDANGDRMCPVWSKGNIVEGVWKDIEGDIWNDSNSDNQPFARVQAFVDSVRAEDLGVHVILCNE